MALCHLLYQTASRGGVKTLDDQRLIVVLLYQTASRGGVKTPVKT